MSQAPLSVDAPLFAEPLVLFDESFILEFPKPDLSLDSTVLMRVTYKHDHPWIKKGKAHPQAPPLHIHFAQAESFQVLQGTLGTTLTYAAKGRVFTPSDGPYCIDTWIPHRFWPDPDSTEDCVALIWAHPRYISDVSEKQTSIDLLQIMYMQHATDSALIMFPTASFLGPLRWWVPWVAQAGLATVARILGYLPVMEKYTPPAEWKKIKAGLKTD